MDRRWLTKRTPNLPSMVLRPEAVRPLSAGPCHSRSASTVSRFSILREKTDRQLTPISGHVTNQQGHLKAGVGGVVPSR